jgi:hypothetical protein
MRDFVFAWRLAKVVCNPVMSWLWTEARHWFRIKDGAIKKR